MFEAPELRPERGEDVHQSRDSADQTEQRSDPGNDFQDDQSALEHDEFMSRFRLDDFDRFAARSAQMLQRRAHQTRPAMNRLAARSAPRRSGLPPGTSRSISLSSTSGRTFFRRKAMPRRMIVVTARIEQTSNGHMKKPPELKNCQTAFTG